MVTRRRIVLALGAGALAAPFAPFAQQSERVYRIGILGTGSAASFGPLFDAFTQGLREFGYVEGRNLSIERRHAEGNPEALAAMAAELVQQKVAVIFAHNSPAVEAAKKATGTIPIVFATAGDPVGSGFVASLARPGGNITGTTNIPQELGAKRLQLLKEAFPKIARVAVIGTFALGSTRMQLEETERAGRILGIQVLPVQVHNRGDLGEASAQMRKLRADSVLIPSSPTMPSGRRAWAKT